MAQKRLTDTTTREQIKGRDSLRKQHAGKRPEQIEQADVLEWAKTKMLEDLKLSG